MSLRLEAVEEGFASAAGWWDGVLERSARVSPFASHAWLARWWETYGAGSRLMLLRLVDGSQVVGGVAFYLRARRLEGVFAVRELRLVGDRHVGSEGLDAVVARGHEAEAAAALSGHLGQARGWDVAHLQGLRPGAVLLRPEAFAGQRASAVRAVNRCPVLSLPTDRPVAPLKKDFASRVARKSRGLLDRGSLKFARCCEEREITPLLEALFADHQTRWAGRGEAGAFADEKKRSFYGRVAVDLLRSGRLELFGLWDGDRPRAVLFGASGGKTLFYLQSAFDSTLAPHGPGNVLMYQILRQVQERGFERFDFMKGDEAYKFQWTSEEEPLLLRRVVGRGWRARLAGAALALSGRMKVTAAVNEVGA
jgi:CelD/BcsL family acetyltransferase involved in cellulose biosynthesis